MSEEKRSYRQNLASYALIFLAGEELEIKIKNLSISGILATLKNNGHIKEVKEVFEAIKFSPTVDIYIPEMRLEGEAELVRVDMVDGVINLALEYRNIFHNVDHVLYKRKAYRKNMSSPGQIVFFGKKYAFITKNVSVDGLMIYLEEKIDVEPGTKTIFDFKKLKLRGLIKVAWSEPHEEGGTLMGLYYEQMGKEHIKGIPRFSSDSS